MNTSPLISVIIPVYNREKYIRNCLNIITNQSYKHLEIIVVDDGSSDNSVDIIKEFSSVKLIQHKVNKGQSVARNTGLDIAKGKYVHFMDDDDEITHRFYEDLLNASEETNADISCCGLIHQKQKGKSQVFKKQKEYTTINDKLLITYVGKWGYSVRYLFRLEFLNENKLRFEEGKLIEDLPFSFMSVFYANKIVTVPTAKYLYVFNPNSSLNTKNKDVQQKRRIGREYSNKFVLDFAKNNGNFPIPGVTTGVLKYILRKLYLNLTPRKTLN